MARKPLLTRRTFLGGAPAAAAALMAGCARAEGNPIPQPDYSIPQNGFQGKAENKRQWNGDPRSDKVVFVAHCVLNQNARMIDCADFPAMFDPLVDFLQERQVGMIQMVCPELYCLGLGRFDVRVGLESGPGGKRLERLIDDLVFTLKEYRFQGFEVVGILGKQGSPSCGVTRTWLDGKEQDGEGVFIRQLKKRLAAEQLDTPVIGVADYEQDKAIEWLKERLG
ncbi:hypothetical protein LLH00_16245 [bacterium]|nr:hypothetical protein [bacterium]